MKTPIATRAISALLASLNSNAAVLTFDDIANGTYGGYAGFSFVNLSVYNPNNAQFGFNNSGAVNGIVSGLNVGFRNTAGLLQFSSAAPFIFNSGYFTAVWNDGLSVVVNGLRNGLITNTLSFVAQPTSPALINFNWTNIDTITINASGGTFHTGFTGGSGTALAFDNLIVNSPVPEPTVAVMLGVALTAWAATSGLRRRRFT